MMTKQMKRDLEQDLFLNLENIARAYGYSKCRLSGIAFLWSFQDGRC